MKVLWIDDEFDTLELINESAAENDIELIGFKSAEEALKELEHPENYDAVILDGLFYLGKNEKGIPSKQTAFGKVASKLITLKERSIILPWFILSGKKGFTLDQNSMVEALSDKDFANGKVFDKKTKEEKLLWPELKKAVEAIPEYIVQSNYKKLFEICEKHFSDEIKKNLIKILLSIKNPTQTFDDELYFTQIRIILESLFRIANKAGLLHDKCIDNSGKVNLTEASLFLSGLPTNHLNISCATGHFTKIISDTVKNILFITGAASHTSDPDIKKNVNIQEYRKIINTPYLLYSLCFQLIDVIIWFDDYLKTNNDPLKNKSLWIEIVSAKEGDWISGALSIIAPNGFGTFQPDDGSGAITIPPQMITDNNLKEKQQIKIIIEIKNNKKLTQQIQII